MHVLIIGGDKIAYYLIGLLDPKRYRVTLVDRRLDVCTRMANDYPISVYVGDGTDASVLERVDAASADLMLALTGKDEANLVACQLGKHVFGIRETISLVNNPANEASLRTLGVDRTFSGTAILAALFDEEIEFPGLRTAYNIPGNNRAIVEFVLHPDSEAVGRTLADFPFPESQVMVLVTRTDGRVLTPQGDLSLEPGDRCLLLCPTETFDRVWSTYVAPGESPHTPRRRTR